MAVVREVAGIGAFAAVTAFWSATWQTFLMISFAELFDKTFFVALILALRFNKTLVFVGCFGALLVHTVLAAGAGYLINRYVDKVAVDFSTAALYMMFAVFYFWDCYNADPDGDVMEGMEEAREVLGEYGSVDAVDVPEKKRNKKRDWDAKLLLAAFTTTFIAEMGDRTQIAMIGQHAVQPIWPVMLGSAVAFLQLTAIAVLTGVLLEKQGLKERTVLFTGALSFLFFALITLRDGLYDVGYLKQ
jgi:putative Ca2+/H+ antiporter (TMEM165/GDT1 family)